MTLRSRNLLIVFIFLLLSLGIALLVYIALKIDFKSPNFAHMSGEGMAKYLIFKWKLSPDVLYINFLSPIISNILAWLTALLFLRYFRKVTSPQLFFLILFWLSMGVELVRAVNLLQIQNDAALDNRLFLSRIELMGQLFGSLSLFAASLYMAGIKVQHQETVLFAILGVSSVMAYLIPIDNSQVGQELLYIPAEGFSLDSFRLLTDGLTLVNFIKYAMTSKDKSAYLLAIPILFMVAGQELQLIATDWFFTVVSWTFLTVGTIWVSRRFINNYMWY